MVNLPLVGVLALIVCLLVKRSGLKAGHTVTCLLLGFYLASSSVAPTINDAVVAVLDELGCVRF